MVAGYAGTNERATYTCIGDTVNLASRLEAHTKVAARTILIDGATRAALGDRVEVEPLGPVADPGQGGAGGRVFGEPRAEAVVVHGAHMQLMLERIEQRLGAQVHLYPLDLTLVPLAVTVLLGATQAGKTTLMRVMAGLDAPEQGSRAG